MRKKIAGIILAAGSSTRMGEPKALLQIDDTTFLSRIVENLRSVGHDPIRIIASRHFPDIIEHHPEFEPLMIRNDEPELGQLHSLRLGILDLTDEIDALTMCLVDHPDVRRSTYAALLNDYNETNEAIILPSYKGKRGHPVLFDRSTFRELLTVPLEGGARTVVRAKSGRVRIVAVDDPGVIIDVDTREDYRRLRKDG